MVAIKINFIEGEEGEIHLALEPEGNPVPEHWIMATSRLCKLMVEKFPKAKDKTLAEMADIEAVAPGDFQ